MTSHQRRARIRIILFLVLVGITVGWFDLIAAEMGLNMTWRWFFRIAVVMIYVGWAIVYDRLHRQQFPPSA